MCRCQLGSSELTEAVPDFDLFERWLEEQLSHVTLLFEGYGQVRVTAIDDLRIDVRTTFVVEESSVFEVLDRFRGDFDLLRGMTCGIDVAETKTFKFCFPKIAGERLDGIFIR